MTGIKIDKLVRSRRRSIALEVSLQGELIVRAPLHAPTYIIESFIKEKQNWIIKKQSRRSCFTQTVQALSCEEIKSYKQKARAYMPERVALLARQWGFLYRGIKITSARRRWGSCTHVNNLNFSWRLMMTPDEIIDYVIVHELAHTKEKNHGKRFWQLMLSIMPDYTTRRRWLKEHSGLLAT